MTTTDNLRRHERVTVPADILLSDDYHAVNLSESGMLIGAPRKLSIGRDLSLILMIDDSPVKLLGRVRHCREAASVYDAGFFVGIEFQNHSVSDQLCLRRFVKACKERGVIETTGSMRTGY